MSEIPEVGDQFTPEAPSEEATTAPRFTPTLDDRLRMFVSLDVELEDLRQALANGGFAVTSHPEGWCVDRVRAVVLLERESANDAPPRDNLYLHLERSSNAE